MKRMLWAGIFLMAAVPVSANNSYHDSILEWQLRDFSDAHKSFQKERAEHFKKLEAETRSLAVESEQTYQEYEMLKSRIEEQAKDNVHQAENVKKLDESKAKLRAELEEKNAEYDELAAVLRTKRAEIEKMRDELSRDEKYFNEELLNFYREEEKRLSEKIDNCRQRQNELRQKIQDQSAG